MQFKLILVSRIFLKTEKLFQLLVPRMCQGWSVYSTISVAWMTKLVTTIKVWSHVRDFFYESTVHFLLYMFLFHILNS